MGRIKNPAAKTPPFVELVVVLPDGKKICAK
jgi:hypothetical protein